MTVKPSKYIAGINRWDALLEKRRQQSMTYTEEERKIIQKNLLRNKKRGVKNNGVL